MNSHFPKSALLITVNYKGEQSTLDLLASLQRVNDAKSLEVIVVDNCSGHDRAAVLRSAVSSLRYSFRDVRVLELGENYGYFGGARYALKTYLERAESLPEWIIVCNNDITIDDPEFLRKLHSLDHGDSGILAPRIRLKTIGLDQNPFMRRRPGKFRWAQLRLAYSNYFVAVVWDRLSRAKQMVMAYTKRFSAPNDIKCEQIYAPHGSCVIFSRLFFESGGEIDPELFLYGEEISVAEMCRSLGLRVMFEPRLNVSHNEHTTTGGSLSRLSYQCQKKALQYLWGRYLHKHAVVYKEDTAQA